MLEYQIQLEDGTLLLNETNGSIILENYSSGKSAPVDNADFDSLVTLEGILDFSEKNPFGEIGA